MKRAGRRDDRGIVMVVPYPPGESIRGISAVATTILETEGLEEFDIRTIATTHPGGIAAKITGGLRGGGLYVMLLLARRTRLVHIHTASFNSFGRKAMYALAAFAFRKRVVLHIHGGGFRAYYERSTALWKSFVRLVLRTSDCVIALSPNWGEYFREIAPGSTVLVLPNPVDGTGLFEVPIARPAARPAVLFLGALKKGKGVFDLLDAVPSVVEAIPEARFLLCGTGLLDECRARARELGVADHVEFPGYVSGEAKVTALTDSTLFVLPSYAEGLPVSLIEAMAAGLPVVTTAVGGIPDYVRDGTHGYLVAPGDVKALSDRIIRLLGDGEARTRMGTTNRDLARTTFDARKIVTSLRRLYQRLLG